MGRCAGAVERDLETVYRCRGARRWIRRLRARGGFGRIQTSVHATGPARRGGPGIPNDHPRSAYHSTVRQPTYFVKLSLLVIPEADLRLSSGSNGAECEECRSFWQLAWGVQGRGKAVESGLPATTR